MTPIDLHEVPGARIVTYTAFRYLVQVDGTEPTPADDLRLVDVVWPDGRHLIVRFDGLVEFVPPEVRPD